MPARRASLRRAGALLLRVHEPRQPIHRDGVPQRRRPVQPAARAGRAGRGRRAPVRRRDRARAGVLPHAGALPGEGSGQAVPPCQAAREWRLLAHPALQRAPVAWGGPRRAPHGPHAPARLPPCMACLWYGFASSAIMLMAAAAGAGHHPPRPEARQPAHCGRRPPEADRLWAVLRRRHRPRRRPGRSRAAHVRAPPRRPGSALGRR